MLMPGIVRAAWQLALFPFPPDFHHPSATAPPRGGTAQLSPEGSLGSVLAVEWFVLINWWLRCMKPKGCINNSLLHCSHLAVNYRGMQLCISIYHSFHESLSKSTCTWIRNTESLFQSSFYLTVLEGVGEWKAVLPGHTFSLPFILFLLMTITVPSSNPFINRKGVCFAKAAQEQMVLQLIYKSTITINSPLSPSKAAGL